jgi:hypothetical protein
MDKSAVISEVLAQAPIGITEDEVRDVMNKLGVSSVVQILAHLWKLPPKEEKPMTEWDRRRKIVDDMEELRKALKGSREHH